MDKLSDALGPVTPGRHMPPNAPEPKQAGTAVPILGVRTEQGDAPLFAQSQPGQGMKLSDSGEAPRFLEEEYDSSQEEDPLDAAILQEDPAAIEAALLKSDNLARRAAEDPLLMHRLAGLGHLSGIRMLINAGANINSRCDRQSTPLLHAAASGQVELVKALLKHGAHPGKRDDAGNTALHVAVLCGKHNVAAELMRWMSAGQIDRANEIGCSALFGAVLTGDAAMVRVLLQGGARPDCYWYENQRVTPLMFGARRQELEIVTDLLDAGARHDALDEFLETPLFHAVRGGSVACIDALADAGADVNARNVECWTPLLCAVALSRADLVHALLRRGAAMAHQPRLLRSIGYASCKSEDMEFIEEGEPCRRILSAPYLERVPQPALLLAASEGLDEMVKLLIEAGADVNFVAANGDTALARASELGHCAIVERLLAHGARQ